MRFTREFYTPKNPAKIIERQDLNAVAYLVDTPTHGKTFALGFSGKRAKPDFHYSFKSSEDRDKYLARYFENLAANLKRKAEYAESKKNASKQFLASLKPGAILCDTWGYEQTQVEFYKVLEVKGSKVKIVELGAVREGEPTSWASDCVMPGAECGAPIWKVVRGQCIRICSSITLTLWDGKSKHRSWYY